MLLLTSDCLGHLVTLPTAPRLRFDVCAMTLCALQIFTITIWCAANRDWIAGLVIGLLLLIALICLIGYCWWRRRHPKPRYFTGCC